MKRTYIIATIAVVAIAAFVYFFWGSTLRSNALRVAGVSVDWFNAPFTLAARGSGNGDAQRISYIDLSSGLASKTAVMSGDADIGLSALPPLLRDPKAREELVILACYMRSDSVIGFATTKQDVPISNLSIGIVEGTISEIYLAQLVELKGGNFVSVRPNLKLVGIRPPDGPALLQNGSLDAAVLWEPHLSRAGEIEGVVVDRMPNLYEISVCAVASRNSLENKQQAVLRFVDRMRRYSQLIEQEKPVPPAELIDLLPASLKIGPAWELVDFSIVTNRDAIATRLANEVRMLKVSGLLVNDVDFSALLSELPGS